MQKSLAIAIIGVLIAAGIPNVEAEDKSARYDIPSGPAGNVGGAVSTRLCAPEWDTGILVAPEDDAAFALACGTGRTVRGDPNDGVVNMGVFSAALRSDCGDCYTNFLVTVTDTLPAGPYFTFCIMTNNPDGSIDNLCNPGSTADPIPDIVASGCSTVLLASSLPAGGSVNHASAFVYATFVDESTGVACLASSGVLNVNMS